MVICKVLFVNKLDITIVYNLYRGVYTIQFCVALRTSDFLHVQKKVLPVTFYVLVFCFPSDKTSVLDDTYIN